MLSPARSDPRRGENHTNRDEPMRRDRRLPQPGRGPPEQPEALFSNPLPLPSRVLYGHARACAPAQRVSRASGAREQRDCREKSEQTSAAAVPNRCRLGLKGRGFHSLVQSSARQPQTRCCTASAFAGIHIRRERRISTNCACCRQRYRTTIVTCFGRSFMSVGIS